MHRALAPLLLLLGSGCTPWGGKIDEETSNNYFYGLFRRSVVFGYGGNCIGPGCTTITGADVASFRPLGPAYAVDENRAYYQARPLEGEIPDGFRFLAGHYALGSRGVYWSGRQVPVEDAASFVTVAFGDGPVPEHYGKDSRAIYCRDNTLSLRPAAFRPLSRANYFADDEAVYFMSGGVCARLDADPSSFEFLSKRDGSPSMYAKDARHVYQVPGSRKIPEAHAVHFVVLCHGSDSPHWAADEQHVFDRGRLVPGAEPRSHAFPAGCELPEDVASGAP